MHERASKVEKWRDEGMKRRKCACQEESLRTESRDEKEKKLR